MIHTRDTDKAILKNKSLDELLSFDIPPCYFLKFGDNSKPINFFEGPTLENKLLSNSSSLANDVLEIEEQIHNKVERIQSYIQTLGDYEQKYINFALNLAYGRHAEAKRKSGLSYFTHVIDLLDNAISVHTHLSNNKSDKKYTLDYITLTAAILHDVPEEYVQADFEKNISKYEKSIPNIVEVIHEKGMEDEKFTADFLYVLKYELFKFADVKVKDPLDTYDAIYQKVIDLKRKENLNYVKRENHPVTFILSQDQLAAEANSAFNEALTTIVNNKIKADLRGHYLLMLEKEMSHFTLENSLDDDLPKHKKDAFLITRQMVSNLSRYKGLLHYYYTHLTEDIAPRFTPISDSDLLHAKLMTSFIKSGDRLSNNDEMWSQGHNDSLNIKEQKVNQLEQLYYTNPTHYYDKKKNYSNLIKNLPRDKKNFLNGEKRLHNLAKSLMALTIIRKQKLYIETTFGKSPDLEMIQEMQERLAQSGIEQSKMQALYQRMFDLEIDVPFIEKAEKDQAAPINPYLKGPGTEKALCKKARDERFSGVLLLIEKD